MQDVLAPIGSAAVRIEVRGHPAVRLALSGLLSAAFFAAVADGLGVCLHLLGVMPLMP